MRRNPTPSEALLWSRLRGRQLGVKFRRQHIVLGYITDFCAPTIRLIVEIDGAVHVGDRLIADRNRAADLQRVGYRIVRVKAWMVERHIEVVLAVIRAAL
jgi:very-short-patch-repair endonuclease